MMIVKRFSLVLLIVFILAIIGGCAETGSIGSDSNSQGNEQTSDKESDIYSDDLIIVDFIKKYTVDGIDGMIYFNLRVTNKSNRKITVYLKDGYFNDRMVNISSGLPLTILPGKAGTNGFFAKYDGTLESIKKSGLKS